MAAEFVYANVPPSMFSAPPSRSRVAPFPTASEVVVIEALSERWSVPVPPLMSPATCRVPPTFSCPPAFTSTVPIPPAVPADWFAPIASVPPTDNSVAFSIEKPPTVTLDTDPAFCATLRLPAIVASPPFETSIVASPLDPIA